MFIPKWVLHIIATLLWFIGVAWAAKREGDYDFGGPIKFLGTTLLYAIYWIAFLALNKGCAG